MSKYPIRYPKGHRLLVCQCGVPVFVLQFIPESMKGETLQVQKSSVDAGHIMNDKGRWILSEMIRKPYKPHNAPEANGELIFGRCANKDCNRLIRLVIHADVSRPGYFTAVEEERTGGFLNNDDSNPLRCLVIFSKGIRYFTPDVILAAKSAMKKEIEAEVTDMMKQVEDAIARGFITREQWIPLVFPPDFDNMPIKTGLSNMRILLQQTRRLLRENGYPPAQSVDSGSIELALYRYLIGEGMKPYDGE